jgi:hypothetical protein
MALYKVKVKGKEIEGMAELTEDIVYTTYGNTAKAAVETICYNNKVSVDDIIEVWFEIL